VGQNSHFGTTSESRQWGGFEDRAPYQGSSTRTAEELESQNDEHLDGLTAKVKLLKEVTIAIGNEVRDSATQLSHMVCAALFL
jgi:blocked early in transport 1